MKKKILFIFTHNSARSQMAECYRMQSTVTGTRHSVTKQKTRVHPMAIAIMKEIGIDI